MGLGKQLHTAPLWADCSLTQKTNQVAFSKPRDLPIGDECRSNCVDDLSLNSSKSLAHLSLTLSVLFSFKVMSSHSLEILEEGRRNSLGKHDKPTISNPAMKQTAVAPLPTVGASTSF